ncbi:MAG: glycosyltransferase [Actinomycetota bacterium]
MIPRLVHFVFGLRPQEEPFHLLHYLAIESCRQVIRPDRIVLHVHELPYGVYWDLARPLVELERIDPVAEVEAKAADPEVARYRYAHHADVVRLDVLARHGGLYADIDTLFVAPLPDELWAAEAVIGREADVTYDAATGPEASVSNALVLARPGAWFVTAWRDRILDAMDGSWSGHSCRLAMRLATEAPDRVRVEPQARFSPYAHTPEGMRALLEEPVDPTALDGTSSVHLCAHLWWEQDRRDFARFSAVDATEAHLRTADTPLALLARPFLPDHGLF